MGSIKKEVDLSSLPRNEKTGNIDWKNSVGCIIPFEYGDLSSEIKIIGYIKDHKTPMICVDYNGKQKNMSAGSIKKCSFGELIGVFTSDFYYSKNQIIKTKHQTLTILNQFYKKEDGRNRKYYEVSCDKCNCRSILREVSLKQNKGCPVCASKIIVKGVNDIPTTAKWMVPYFPGGEDEASQYSICSSQEIQFICPCCNKQMQKSIPIMYLYYHHSCGCQCDTIISFPERVIYNLLKENNIRFIHCATKNNVLPWAENYRYDFYLIDYNVIIETHGAQHYEEHGFNRLGGKSLEEEQKNDIKKKELALNNGISKFYEIDCRKSNVEHILNSCEKTGLLQYLDINKYQINKDGLIENVLFKNINITKRILLNNPNITSIELSDILHISQYMANKILSYAIDSSQLNTFGNNKKSTSKPVYMYKDGQYLASFKSFYDLYTNSKRITGVEVKTHSPKKYVDTGRKYLGHYTFSYMFNEETEVVAC